MDSRTRGVFALLPIASILIVYQSVPQSLYTSQYTFVPRLFTMPAVRLEQRPHVLDVTPTLLLRRHRANFDKVVLFSGNDSFLETAVHFHSSTHCIVLPTRRVRAVPPHLYGIGSSVHHVSKCYVSHARTACFCLVTKNKARFHD